MYLRIHAASPKVNQGEYSIGNASGKGIHEMHNSGGEGHHKAIEDQANGVKRMGPQVVQLSTHSWHGYKKLS